MLEISVHYWSYLLEVSGYWTNLLEIVGSWWLILNWQLGLVGVDQAKQIHGTPQVGQVHEQRRLHVPAVVAAWH